MMPIWRTVEPPPMGTILAKTTRGLRPPVQPTKLSRLETEPLAVVAAVGSESQLGGKRFGGITLLAT